MGFEYANGARDILDLEVAAATADIVSGDALTIDSNGYYKRAAAGEKVFAIAADSLASPATDGVKTVRGDVSKESRYRVPPAAGSVARTDRTKVCDVGTDGQAIDRTAATNGDVVIHEVDLGRNIAYVSIYPAYADIA